mmetsp:Transcript_29646/g.47753  ORF Transcript_29646/g.47753 Transcript_29646/m.47753 type:complete len:229 (-) Transcript_29646:394-1080(-)
MREFGDVSHVSTSCAQPACKSCGSIPKQFSNSKTRSSTEADLIASYSFCGLKLHIHEWMSAKREACCTALSVALVKSGTCRNRAKPRMATSGWIKKSSVKKIRIRSGYIASALAQAAVERNEFPRKERPLASHLSFLTVASSRSISSMSPACSPRAFLAKLRAESSSFITINRGSATKTAINGISVSTAPRLVLHGSQLKLKLLLGNCHGGDLVERHLLSVYFSKPST